MSTRTCIFVVDARGRSHRPPVAIRLYRHCDGYPEGMLVDLAQAVAEAERRATEYRERCKPSGPGPIGADFLASLITVQASSMLGLAVELEVTQPLLGRSWTRRRLQTLLGQQSDLEYLYVVDIGARAVNVYSTKFGILRTDYSGTPLDHLMAGIGPADLAARTAAQYREAYRDECVAAIHQAIAALQAVNWSVNQEPDFVLELAARLGRRDLDTLLRRVPVLTVPTAAPSCTESEALAVSVF
jgi:hypothetical protein